VRERHYQDMPDTALFASDENGGNWPARYHGVRAPAWCWPGFVDTFVSRDGVVLEV
jgi:hypothetical protein